ncbi:MAG: hypothetical protein VXY83_05665 [Pseudomonadota bacterium]|nr:hypothetical protein [Pseudomonadota bacterium]MEC8467833.1 hypothetical protein [Pseudomonadota bacterium]
MTTKAKVYKGVACLEMPSRDGGKWWYQGGSLAYTPILIREIRVLKTGTLKGQGREVMVVPLKVGNQEHLVVLNLPRTDIVELKARGLWPEDFVAPHLTTNYTPWPEYTGGKASTISLA